MTERITEFLLEKYLSDGCSKAEMKRVEEYVNSVEGKLHLDEYLDKVWDGASKERVDEDVLEECRGLFLMEVGSNKRTTTGKKIKSNIMPYLIAAVIFIVLGSAMSIKLKLFDSAIRRFKTEEMVFHENSIGKQTKITLPDGSRVILGAESKIRYPKKFRSSSREIKLEGEAYFEIAKDKEKPFIIHTDEIQTRVVGTSFFLQAFPKNTMSVTVISGKVCIERHLENGGLSEVFNLLPGERGRINQNKNIIEKSMVDFEQVKEWSEGNLVFSSLPLSEVFESLERWYGAKFVVDEPNLLETPLTFTLDRGTALKDVMDGICVAMGVNYEIRGNKVRIYHKY